MRSSAALACVFVATMVPAIEVMALARSPSFCLALIFVIKKLLRKQSEKERRTNLVYPGKINKVVDLATLT